MVGVWLLRGCVWGGVGCRGSAAGRFVGVLVGLVLGVCCGGVGVAVAGVTHSLVSSCAGAGTAAGRFVLPFGVAMDEASEEVFVMDGRGDPPGVQRFSAVGGVCTFVEAIGGAGTPAGEISGEDIAAGPERLFVSSTNDRVVDVFEVGVGGTLLVFDHGCWDPPKIACTRWGGGWGGGGVCG